MPLYPGARTRELCPTLRCSTVPRAGPATGTARHRRDLQARLDGFWRPYHARCATTRGPAGRASATSCCSGRPLDPRPRLPAPLRGPLPDFNLGTAGGSSARPDAATEALDRLGATGRVQPRTDGRFKGGYITRHYGRPAEASPTRSSSSSRQSNYMDEDPPFAFREDLAAGIRPVLRGVIEALLDWQPQPRS